MSRVIIKKFKRNLEKNIKNLKIHIGKFHINTKDETEIDSIGVFVSFNKASIVVDKIGDYYYFMLDVRSITANKVLGRAYHMTPGTDISDKLKIDVRRTYKLNEKQKKSNTLVPLWAVNFVTGKTYSFDDGKRKKYKDGILEDRYHVKNYLEYDVQYDLKEI